MPQGAHENLTAGRRIPLHVGHGECQIVADGVVRPHPDPLLGFPAGLSAALPHKTPQGRFLASTAAG